MSGSVRLQHKRGDTFSVALTVKQDGEAYDLSGFTGASQIRDRKGELLDDLTVEIADATGGKVTLTESDTADWEPGTYVCDVEFDDGDGLVWSTPTLEIQVIPDVTTD